jgi:hydrogenase 3 maturation protease
VDAPNKPARIVVMGVGNELNGDDAAGVLVVRQLNRKLAQVDGIEHILVLEAGLAPENFTGVLRKFKPEIVLVVDAAWLGEKPGAAMLLDGHQLGGFGASTHIQPLATLTEFIEGEFGCAVRAIGIQLGHMDFGRPVSTAVQRACRRLANNLAEMLLNASRFSS